MRKHVRSILYIGLHILVFGALFLPPIWIPNHGNSGWEYQLYLVWELFPIGCIACGLVAAAIPRVPWQARLAAVFSLAVLSFPELGFWGILIYSTIYGSSVGVVSAVLTFITGYRKYRARRALSAGAHRG